MWRSYAPLYPWDSCDTPIRHISTSNTSIFLTPLFYRLFTSHSPLIFDSWYYINKDTLQKALDTVNHLCYFSQLVLREGFTAVRRETTHFYKQNVNLQHITNSVVAPYLCFYPIGNNKSSLPFFRGKLFAFLYIYSVSKCVQREEQTGKILTLAFTTVIPSYAKPPQDSPLIL